MAESLFVACETELQHLQEIFDRTISGQGQICFVTGEAGAGKTTLTAEFTHQAQVVHANLLIAVGNCNAQTGIGDPYLPFREILGQLTGDVENKLTQGAISPTNASRLRNFLSFSGRVVVDLGPDLIDIVLPGMGLIARAGKVMSREPGWAKTLQQRHEQRSQGSESDVRTRNSPQNGQQSHIFEQYTQVLIALAAQQPLVIIIDDLHWADESSTSLLFHLARRIGNSRILLLGTYRPEDVAFGRGERRHPLESVVNEIKRLHGDVQLHLGQDDPDRGRQFINALLDAHPNQLAQTFRERLLSHTRGQPLFTTELLNGMRRRGDLVENAGGQLVEGPALEWSTLPARIEGVIEERIKRLSVELQELLSVASVEGEVFSAQVIARVQGLGERDVLRSLDKELDQQHRLVQEDSVKRIGNQRLSQYRFRHSLLQRYLYNQISQSEREILHESIAQLIEEIYHGQHEEVVGQLARHYEQAGLYEGAADYYLEAGNRAMRLFANEEAANLLQQGLLLLDRVPDSAENAERKVKLQLALGKAQWKMGLAPESMATYQQAASTARTLNSGEYLALAALGYDDPRFRFNLPSEPAVKLLEEALDTLSGEDSMLRVRVACGLVRTQGHAMNEMVSDSLLNHAVAMARRLDDPLALYTALQAKSGSHREPERIEERLAIKDEILQSAARIGDRAPLLDAYMFRIDDLLAVGDIEAVDADISAMESIVKEIHEPFYDYCLTTKLAMRALLRGHFDEAERYAQQGMDCSQQLHVDNAEGVFGMQMFSIRRQQGRLQGLAPIISHFVTTRTGASCWRPGLALIYSELGDEMSARAEFDGLSEHAFADIPHDSLWQTCLSYLSDVCAFLGDKERARILYGLLLPFAPHAIVVGNSVVCYGAASRHLGQLSTTLMEWDVAEAHFQHAIEFNSRLQALPWVALTKHQYASMLQQRGNSGDHERAIELRAEALEVAKAMGMQWLGQEIEAQGKFIGLSI